MPANEDILLDYCRYNRYSLLDILALLSTNINADAKDSTGRTALHWAAENNNSILIELLLRSGASIEAQQAVDYTPLHLAVKNNSLQAVGCLLAYHANIEAKDINGFTPLHWAAYMGHETCVAKLLANNANPYAINNNNLNPMQLGLLNNKIKITQYFYAAIQKNNNSAIQIYSDKEKQLAAAKQEHNCEVQHQVTRSSTLQNYNPGSQQTRNTNYNYFKPVSNTNSSHKKASITYLTF